MLHIESAKVVHLEEKHKKYMKSLLYSRCKEKEKDIKYLKFFFKEYCGNSFENITTKMLEVSLNSNLYQVINEFEKAFYLAYKRSFINEVKKSKKLQYIKAKKLTMFLNYLLGYSGFNKGTVWWNRHLFVKEMDIHVCPYCNRNYITSYEDNGSHTTADVDHYFPKSIYPILQMNLYNMIPSCNVCNSKMKLDSDIRHLYPFKDSDGSLRFKIKDDTLSQLLLYSIEEVKLNVIIEIGNEGRTQGSIDVFKLDKVYEIHHDVVFELIKKIHNYKASEESYYKQMLGNELADKIFERSSISDIWFDFLNKDARKEPLVKLKKDIYKQLM